MLIAGQMSPAQARGLAPLTLAYLGDAVFELYVRERLVSEKLASAGALHRQAVARAKAVAQADALHSFMEKLSEEEADVVRRGRNARTSGRRAIDPATYHYSTAFEALIGFLYLTGQEERLLELMGIAYNTTSDAHK